jgi:ABC-type antimicrobial peptide transport system permease subunit
MALGSDPGRVLRLILREGLALVAVGLAIGFAGAIALRRIIASELYGVSALDPVTYVGVLITMSVCALIATWWPARRAMRLDPVKSLRS